MGTEEIAIPTIKKQKMKKIININPEYSNNNDVVTILENLPAVVKTDRCETIFKKRNEVYRFRFDNGNTIVVKKFRKPNIFQALCYSTIWQNKAVKAYNYANKLRKMGIETPLPIATLTFKKLGIVNQYFFVSTEDMGCGADTVIAPNEILSSSPNVPAMIDALSRFLIEIHEKGFLHGDTNLSNIRFHEVNGGYSFSVIDTNRSKFIERPASMEECELNLCRMSHTRPVLHEIVAAYARNRGWDEIKTYSAVSGCVRKFEKGKSVTKKLKRIFKVD